MVQEGLLGATNFSQSPEFTRWTLEENDTINRVDMWLRGATIEHDEKGRAYMITNTDNEMLNATGRRIVLSTLTGLTHKGIVLSKFTKKEVGDHTEDLHIKLSKELFINWRDIGIKTPTSIPRIAKTISFNLLSAFNRALNADTAERLSKLHSVSEIVQHGGNKGQDGGGGLSFFGGAK